MRAPYPHSFRGLDTVLLAVRNIRHRWPLLHKATPFRVSGHCGRQENLSAIRLNSRGSDERLVRLQTGVSIFLGLTTIYRVALSCLKPWIWAVCPSRYWQRLTSPPSSSVVTLGPSGSQAQASKLPSQLSMAKSLDRIRVRHLLLV